MTKQNLQTNASNVLSMGSEQLLFMPKLYDETMDLLVKSRDYFSMHSIVDQHHLSPLQKFLYSAVMTRITLRLSCTMKWVLARRAYHAGQISEEEMMEEYNLGYSKECLQDSEAFSHFLPDFVRKLCNDSMKLYSRIEALDNIQQAQAHSS